MFSQGGQLIMWVYNYNYLCLMSLIMSLDTPSHLCLQGQCVQPPRYEYHDEIVNKNKQDLSEDDSRASFYLEWYYPPFT